MQNLVRTGAAAVVGIGSGALDAGLMKDIKLSDTQKVAVATVLEAVAVVGGGLLQFLSPNTMPAVVDGVVDGGIALLARRGSHYAITESKKPKPSASFAPYSAGALMNGSALLASAQGRAAIGNVPSMPRSVLH